MPHKYNADSCHRIPKRRYKVTNWQAYEAGLRQRGSLTIWFSEEAISAWRAVPRTTPGGQARYSDLASEASLILRAVFHQPLRRTEELVGSLLGLMGLNLPVPDQTTLNRLTARLAINPRSGRRADRAFGWSRSMEPSAVAPGGSCTWASMPKPA
jgi:hypothetical protein